MLDLNIIGNHYSLTGASVYRTQKNLAKDCIKIGIITSLLHSKYAYHVTSTSGSQIQSIYNETKYPQKFNDNADISTTSVLETPTFWTLDNTANKLIKNQIKITHYVHIQLD